MRAASQRRRPAAGLRQKRKPGHAKPQELTFFSTLLAELVHQVAILGSGPVAGVKERSPAQSMLRHWVTRRCAGRAERTRDRDWLRARRKVIPTWLPVRKAAARRTSRSRCRAGGYHHRLPHPSARRPYRVGRPGGVLFFPDAVVMCGAVEWETPPIAPRQASSRAGWGLPSPRPRGCSARPTLQPSSSRRCQRTSQPWPHSWSLRRPRVFQP